MVRDSGSGTYELEQIPHISGQSVLWFNYVAEGIKIIGLYKVLNTQQILFCIILQMPSHKSL